MAGCLAIDCRVAEYRARDCRAAELHNLIQACSLAWEQRRESGLVRETFLQQGHPKGKSVIFSNSTDPAPCLQRDPVVALRAISCRETDQLIYPLQAENQRSCRQTDLESVAAPANSLLRLTAPIQDSDHRDKNHQV